jgi:hypothetical protein
VRQQRDQFLVSALREAIGQQLGEIGGRLAIAGSWFVGVMP